MSGEELWVIAKPAVRAPASRDDNAPGCGAMLAIFPGQQQDQSQLPGVPGIPVPLKHTDVKASIAGYIATVDVTQQFHNPYDTKIEAVYVFPLPENAAVSEFVMTIGERRIRGIIREREEATRIYEQAKAQGYRAALLTQERPNIFTQKVANIEPGKRIDVNIRYFHTLAYADGWYEFVFPMVVGPRFNPPGSNTGVGAISRGVPGRSGQTTEVQYLRPTERSGHDIALTLDIDAGVAIEEMHCLTHVTTATRRDETSGTLALADADAIPNKDFVLRYRVAGEAIKASMLAHRDRRGHFFTLMLYPPAQLKNLPRQPMEMVFVLDCSGSMAGYPIAKAKEAVTRALKHLTPDDTFQVIRFSDAASSFGNAPLPATPEHIQRARTYVENINGEGGTMMIEGIKAALDFPHDPSRYRVVAFLTDGYIGNEAQILGEVHKRLGPTRIFSFGVGSSVNRYLLESLAAMGRGTVAYLGPDDSAADVIDLYFNRVSHPAMTDLAIDFGELRVSDVYPSRLPDLFVGRPVIVTGRFDGGEASTIRVTGRAGSRDIALEIPTGLGEADDHPAIPLVWARRKIAELAEEQARNPGAQANLAARIQETALTFGLLSNYTAFLAVDASERTAGTLGTTVTVPVPVPEGVKYETTVDER